MWVDLAITLVKILFIIGITVGFFAPILTWVERKQSAIMQDRIGANRADILGFTVLGLFHCIADALKMFTKEDFIPEGANKILHTLSPIIAVVPAILTFAVVPFGGQYTIFDKEVNLVISDLDVGLLFVFAIASLATYGYVIAGWSSNNNWSLLGSMRTASQMISYEVTMGLTIVGVLMVYGSMKLTTIGAIQEDFFRWGLFLQPLGFFMFLAASIAENKRIPFDNPSDPFNIVNHNMIKASGGDPFYDYQLPKVMYKIRQGIGRLIRSDRDIGVCIITDPRVANSNYGRNIVDDMPVIPKVYHHLDQVISNIKKFLG